MITQKTVAVLTREEGGGFILHPQEGEIIPDYIRGFLGAYLSAENAQLSDGFPVRILFHQSESNVFSDWGQDYLLASPDSEPMPLLHILFGVDLLHPEEDQTVVFPRSARILDSSIWNFCIWHDEKREEDLFEKRIERALREIYRNWEMHLYELGSTLEYSDLNARLAKNSYFKGGHHSERVSPFLFHSEYVTRETLLKRLSGWKGAGNAYCFGRRWRFLLVDDHSSSPLSGQWSERVVSGGPTKLDIILARLQFRSIDDYEIKLAYRKSFSSQWEGDTKNYDIAIDCVSNLQELTARLFGEEKRRYDIILMDYLLGDMEYSYDFFYVLQSLRDILSLDVVSLDTLSDIVSGCGALPIPDKPLPLELKDNMLTIYGMASHSVDAGLQEWIKKGIGPMERLYFMYISAFVHAIQERLEEQRISRAEKYWYIGRGACPVNTPEVFLFNLHTIMELRYRRIVEKDESGVFTGVPDFLNRIFDKDMSRDKDRVQKDCRFCFPELLRLKSVFEGLPRDLYPDDPKNGVDAAGSILLGSIFENREYYTREFWEHLQHLCYLISFGTVRQWPEWWEEYLFIRPVLEKTNEGKIVAGKIKEYIVSFAH